MRKMGGIVFWNYLKFRRRATPLDHDDDDDADAATKKRVPFLADFRVRVVAVRVCVSTPTPIFWRRRCWFRGASKSIHCATSELPCFAPAFARFDRKSTQAGPGRRVRHPYRRR